MSYKILLIIPPMFINRDFDFEIGVPVNLLFLGRLIQQSGIEVEYFDMTLEEKEGNNSFKKLKNFLIDSNIKLVGISNHTISTTITTTEIAKYIKSLRPDIKIVVGGVNATFMWKELLESCKDIDFILRGYAQKGLFYLSMFLQKKFSSQVPGLVIRQKNDFNISPTAQIESLDFPVPRLTDLEYERYLKWTKAYPLLTHIGCKFSCKFCTSTLPFTAPQKEIFRSTEDIIAEISDANNLGFEKFNMTANNFTSNKMWCLEFCNSLIKKGINKRIYWTCMTRFDFVDREILETLKAAGCINIGYGLEMYGKTIWKKIKKGNFSEEKIKSTFFLTHKVGISTSAFIIIGAPEQKSNDITKMIELLREIDPDFRVINFFQPFPGTSYWENRDKYGLSEISPLENWNFYEKPICRTRYLDKSQLINYMYKLYLDRENGMGIEPINDCLAICKCKKQERLFNEMPEHIGLIFKKFDGTRPISQILNEIAESYSPRERLITLYWLSYILKDGIMKISKKKDKN